MGGRTRLPIRPRCTEPRRAVGSRDTFPSVPLAVTDHGNTALQRQIVGSDKQGKEESMDAERESCLSDDFHPV